MTQACQTIMSTAFKFKQGHCDLLDCLPSSHLTFGSLERSPEFAFQIMSSTIYILLHAELYNISSIQLFQGNQLPRIVNCTGLVQVLEILESPGISGNHFPGLESPGILMQVLESPGNLNYATSF